MVGCGFSKEHSMEPKGHGCVWIYFEYTCLNADFCDFTVPAYRREPLPFAALVGWINVQNCSHCSPH